MKIGIGLPASQPGVEGKHVLDWAKRAEAASFSSLGLIDRLVYGNFEPLITFAAVAGATERIRLMTTILLAPIRTTAILAKQASSLDALSGGRLTLGLGIGGREDDFRAASASFHDRGKRFDEQLALMQRIWSGQPVNQDGGKIGPQPVQAGGPEVLIGGYSAPAIQRLARYGNGFIASGDAKRVGQFFGMATDVWQKAGRSGKPRLVACSYYGLGPDAANRAGKYILDYYAFMGPMAQQMANTIPSSPEAIQHLIAGFTELGADEVMLWPCISDLDQIDQLAEVVGK